ncbi:MAG: lipoprotein, partial [Spiroplasma ixodetis]|nr:lipoprotein [Spiroplasma ixodetis]
MKKLLSMIGAMTLIGTTSTNVIACDGGNEPKPETITDLTSIITTTNLGIIYVGQLEKPNKNQILEAIKKNNPNASSLTQSDFDFEDTPTATTVIINGKNNYKGKVPLNFTISMFKKIDTNDINDNFAIQSVLKINNTIFVSTNATNSLIYKSTDGSTFTAMTGTSGAIWSLAVDNNILYAGSQNGTVYKSTDGSTFTAMTGT